MDESESLVILAINVDPVQLPVFQEILEENDIHFTVTGGNEGYGARGIMYVSKGIGTYTIKVKRRDEEKAIKILSDLGFSVFNEDAEEQHFLSQLATPTEKITFLAKYSLNTRLAIMGFVIAGVITLLVMCLLLV